MVSKVGNNLKDSNTPSPLELLILASLRYFGHSWTFDDLAEATAISISALRDFFHTFIIIASTIFNQKHIIAPTNQEEADYVLHSLLLKDIIILNNLETLY